MRWGLIGTRGLVDKGGLNAFEKAENAELVAALSSDPERAKEFGAEHDVETATAASTIFSAPGLVAVWIASPTGSTTSRAGPHSEAGKHVLLEKPLAIDAGEGLGPGRGCEGCRGRCSRRATRPVCAGPPDDEATDRRGRDRRGLRGQDVLRNPPPWSAAGVAPERETHAGARSRTSAPITSTCSGCCSARSPRPGDPRSPAGLETDDAVAATIRLESGVLARLTCGTNAWVQYTPVQVHGTAGALVADDTSPAGQGEVTLLRRDAGRRT